MAKAVFSSDVSYPIGQKPKCSPNEALIYTDIFDLQNTLRILMMKLDSRLLGENQFFPPPTAGWTEENLGTSTHVVTDYEHILEGGGVGNTVNISYIRRALTSPTVEIITRLNLLCPTKSHLGAGLGLRDATGKLITFGVYMNSGSFLSVRTYNSATSFVSELVSFPFADISNLWLKIADDGVDRKFYVSNLGDHWTELLSHPSATFLTASDLILHISTQNAATPNLAPVARFVSLEVK